MSDQPGRKRARLLKPSEKKEIYDEVYKDRDTFPSLEVEDELFTKDSQNFTGISKYSDYYVKLKEMEGQECDYEEMEREIEEKRRKLKLEEQRRELRKMELEAMAEERELRKMELEDKKKERELQEMKFEAERLQRAVTKFVNIFPKNFDERLLISVANKLGLLLFNFVENNLDDKNLKKVVELIIKNYPDCPEFCDFIRKYQKSLDKSVLIPRDAKTNSPVTPSSMTPSNQVKAAAENMNFIYPFPFNGVETHFPVFYCHPVFSDFIDIVHNRESENAVNEYNKFLNHDIRKNLDGCVSQLILALLKFESEDQEKNLVGNLAEAFKKLFVVDTVQSNLRTRVGTNISSSKFTMDAAVVVGKFPFIIVEAKNYAYSVNAVLQGLQYYGLSNENFIDNDPVFLITVDKGILFVYGAAKVNKRVVCTCLLSMEFTRYFFNVGDFTGKLYRCLGALRFFHDNFTKRMKNIESDQQHLQYSAVKLAPSHNDQPLPAIFTIKREDGSQERINIKIKENDTTTILKPGVYKVEADGQPAILKLACNYNIDVHRTLYSHNLAPKLLGHEILSANCHVILMEYLDNCVYHNISDFLNDKNSEMELNLRLLHQSLAGILDKFKKLNIVHGDFRSCNILAKRSENDGAVLESFKLVDFEYSGKVDERYPFLGMKNPDIAWPSDFISYAPRKFEHDQHMLKQIVISDFQKGVEDLK